MRKVLALSLVCAMLLLITACTGQQGEALSNASGDGIITLTGDGLRSPSINSGGGSAVRASGAPREQTATGLSGTYRSTDGSGLTMTFSGNKIIMGGPEYDDELAFISAMGGSMVITYEIIGNIMAITMTVSFMGETDSFTEWLDFEPDGNNAFILDGERFVK